MTPRPTPLRRHPAPTCAGTLAASRGFAATAPARGRGGRAGLPATARQAVPQAAGTPSIGPAATSP